MLLTVSSESHTWVTGKPGAHTGFCQVRGRAGALQLCGACLAGRDGTAARASAPVWPMSIELGRSFAATRHAATSGSRPSATCRRSMRCMDVSSRSRSLKQVSLNSSCSADQGDSPACRTDQHINQALMSNAVQQHCSCLGLCKSGHAAAARMVLSLEQPHDLTQLCARD